jgi:hypothetical protein
MKGLTNDPKFPFHSNPAKNKTKIHIYFWVYILISFCLSIFLLPINTRNSNILCFQTFRPQWSSFNMRRDRERKREREGGRERGE